MLFYIVADVIVVCMNIRDPNENKTERSFFGAPFGLLCVRLYHCTVLASLLSNESINQSIVDYKATQLS